MREKLPVLKWASWTVAFVSSTPFDSTGTSWIRPPTGWSVSKAEIVSVVSELSDVSALVLTTGEELGYEKFAFGAPLTAIVVSPKCASALAVKVWVFVPDVTVIWFPDVTFPLSAETWSDAGATPLVRPVVSVTEIGAVQRPLAACGLEPLPYQQ